MGMIEALESVINEYNLLAHPFYQAWSQGLLSKAVLKDYAIQYYHQVASFPRFITRIHTYCDDIRFRKPLVHNLIDEEIHGKDHPSLWMQFAEGMGALPDEVTTASADHDTQQMVNEFYTLAERDWRQGLCALYAYESQVPGVSASKIEGLQKHYGITDPMTLEFFEAHLAYDVEHARQVADLLQASGILQEDAMQATRAAAKALWQFLDGMCEKHNIVCH